MLHPPLGTFGQAGVAAFVPVLLYSRLEDDELLSNAVRARIQAAVQRHPGASLQQVRKDAGIGWGTTVYHLRRLERGGFVVSVRSGHFRRYFLSDSQAGRQREHRAQAALLAEPVARQTAFMVAARPGLDQRTLCAHLGIRNPTASKRMGRLVDAGLVEARRDGRRCRYFPTDALLKALPPGLTFPVPVADPASAAVVPAPAPAAAIFPLPGPMAFQQDASECRSPPNTRDGKWQDAENQGSPAVAGPGDLA